VLAHNSIVISHAFCLTIQGQSVILEASFEHHISVNDWQFGGQFETLLELTLDTVVTIADHCRPVLVLRVHVLIILHVVLDTDVSNWHIEGNLLSDHSVFSSNTVQTEVGEVSVVCRPHANFIIVERSNCV